MIPALHIIIILVIFSVLVLIIPVFHLFFFPLECFAREVVSGARYDLIGVANQHTKFLAKKRKITHPILEIITELEVNR